MANSSINLVNLDFDLLKSSFISYLKEQTQFKDYNFDSSNMNVMLDVLTYNTFKNAFYLNMTFAEAFLDSAQLKESLFSHAKELNYLPRSVRSSVANVTVSFTASGENQPYVIRKGETFSTVIKQDSYVFSTDENIILTSSNNSYSATMNIYEGFYVTDTYVVDYAQGLQRFKITNATADTNSVGVLVYENNDIVPKKYRRATTLLDLTENSEVFFLQASSDGKYEVVFGDGVIGYRPRNGSTVVLDYRVSAGSVANGARVFNANFDPTGVGELTSSVTVSVNKYSDNTQGSYSVNGDEAETNDSIRYYAPRHFQTQERAVTVSDYETILKTEFPEIGAVSVYGGEEVNPPRYGKVFIAVDVKNVEGLPEAKKTEYYNFIKSRSPLSIDPLFTEPAFTYVDVVSKIKYNINITTKTAQNLRASTVLAVTNFSEVFLNDFKSTLRYSKLVSTIDDVDVSIVSNETDLKVYKKLVPKLATSQNIDIDFAMPLAQTYYILDKVSTLKAIHEIDDVHIISSSLFTYNGEKCEIEDNGNGILRIIKKAGNAHTVVRNVGTVDYETGKLQLINFNIDSFDGNFFKVFARTKEKDIIGSRNEILQIEPDGIDVSVEAIRE
jgi:hypothetical protein